MCVDNFWWLFIKEQLYSFLIIIPSLCGIFFVWISSLLFFY